MSEPRGSGPLLFIFFFFNDTATTEIYTLSLHDALPIFSAPALAATRVANLEGFQEVPVVSTSGEGRCLAKRSEEHTSELQSRLHLVCRLLLEKKKTLPAIPNTAER